MLGGRSVSESREQARLVIIPQGKGQDANTESVGDNTAAITKSDRGEPEVTYVTPAPFPLLYMKKN